MKKYILMATLVAAAASVPALADENSTTLEPIESGLATVTPNYSDYAGAIYTWVGWNTTNFHDGGYVRNGLDADGNLLDDEFGGTTWNNGATSSTFPDLYGVFAPVSSTQYDIATLRFTTPGTTITVGDISQTVSATNKTLSVSFSPLVLGGLIVEQGASGYSIEHSGSRSVTFNSNTSLDGIFYGAINEDFSFTMASYTFYGTQYWNLADGKKVAFKTNTSTIDGDAVVNVAGAGTFEVAALTNSGTLNVMSGATVSASGTVSNAGTLTIDNAKFSAGTVSNTGTLNLFNVAATVGDATSTADVAITTLSGAGTVFVGKDASITFSGTQEISGLLSVDEAVTGTVITVAADANLTLSGKVDLTDAILNKGTITLTSSTVFVLDGNDDLYSTDTSKDDRKYQLISGGTIVGFANLGKTSFEYEGDTLSYRKTIYVDNNGSLTKLTEITSDSSYVWDGAVIISGEVANLVWGGSETGGVWNTTSTDTWTYNGNADKFYTADNVTFNSDTSLSLGENISAKYVTADGNLTLEMAGHSFNAYEITVAENKVVTIDNTDTTTTLADLTGDTAIKGAGTFSIGSGVQVAAGASLTTESSGSFTGTLAGTLIVGGNAEVTLLGTNVSSGSLNVQDSAQVTLTKTADTDRPAFSSISIDEKATLTASGTITIHAGTLSGAGTLDLNSSRWGTSNNPTMGEFTGKVILSNTGGSTSESLDFNLYRNGTASTIVLNGFFGYDTNAWASNATGKNYKDDIGNYELVDQVNASGTITRYAFLNTAATASTSYINTYTGKITGSGTFASYVNESFKFSPTGYSSSGSGDLSEFTGMFLFNNTNTNTSTLTFADAKLGDGATFTVKWGANTNQQVVFEYSYDETFAGTFAQGNISKTGDGTLKLTGESDGFAGTMTVSAGTLDVASSSALGSSTLTVNADATLKISTAAVTAGAVTFAAGSKLVIGDLLTGPSALAAGDIESLNLICATSITLGDTTLTDGTITDSTLLSYVELDSAVTSFTLQSLSYSGGTLSASIKVIPEPSLFGLLAGTLALVLAGTRRRRGNRK